MGKYIAGAQLSYIRLQLHMKLPLYNHVKCRPYKTAVNKLICWCKMSSQFLKYTLLSLAAS